MKYEVFASFEPNPDFKSGTIMKATNCSFSHVGIIENGDLIFEAHGGGFRSISMEEFMVNHAFAHRFELNVLDPEFAAGWLRGNVGKDYSESQFVGFLLKHFKENGFTRWIYELVGDGNSELICSEAVVRFGLECCGLEFDGDPDFVSPEESIEIMRKAAK